MSDIPHWDPSIFPTTPHVWIVQEVNPVNYTVGLIGIFTSRELALEATRGVPCMFVAPVPLDHMASLGPQTDIEWVGGEYPNNVGPDMIDNPMSRDDWKALHMEGLA